MEENNRNKSRPVMIAEGSMIFLKRHLEWI